MTQQSEICPEFQTGPPRAKKEWRRKPSFCGEIPARLDHKWPKRSTYDCRLAASREISNPQCNRPTSSDREGRRRRLVVIPTSGGRQLPKEAILPILASAWVLRSAPFPSFNKTMTDPRRLHEGSEIFICCVGGSSAGGRLFLCPESKARSALRAALARRRLGSHALAETHSGNGSRSGQEGGDGNRFGGGRIRSHAFSTPSAATGVRAPRNRAADSIAIRREDLLDSSLLLIT